MGITLEQKVMELIQTWEDDEFDWSPWEVSFIESLMDFDDVDLELSDAQKVKVVDLYDKLCTLEESGL